MRNTCQEKFFVAAFVSSMFFSAPVLILASQQAPLGPAPISGITQRRAVDKRVPGSTGQPQPTAVKDAKPYLDQDSEYEIRLDVQRLYAMATELKDEVDETNANEVLSVGVVKRAQDIQKLAKQIKDRAKK